MLNKLAAENTIELSPPQGSGFEALEKWDFQTIVPKLIQILLVGAGLIFFFMLLWGGISWILSGGDKGQTEAARNRITAALVGLVIVFSAWAIASLVGTFFGVDILNLNVSGITN